MTMPANRPVVLSMIAGLEAVALVGLAVAALVYASMAASPENQSQFAELGVRLGLAFAAFGIVSSLAMALISWRLWRGSEWALLLVMVAHIVAFIPASDLGIPLRLPALALSGAVAFLAGHRFFRSQPRRRGRW